MKIAAFVYDFEHEKSCRGLLELACAGYKNVTCFAAPRKTINIQPSSRITPIIKSQHPARVARALGYEYIVERHEHEKLKGFEDVGVILGARILSEKVIKQGVPIINMHPGLLPHNRNMDNVKWAILDGLPQGVTTHFIDKNVDRGRLIDWQIIKVYEDDTLLDIYLRLLSKEMEMMGMALGKHWVLRKSGHVYEKLGKGKYNKVVTPGMDKALHQKFIGYKKNYEKMVKEFLEVNI